MDAAFSKSLPVCDNSFLLPFPKLFHTHPRAIIISESIGNMNVSTVDWSSKEVDATKAPSPESILLGEFRSRNGMGVFQRTTANGVLPCFWSIHRRTNADRRVVRSNRVLSKLAVLNVNIWMLAVWTYRIDTVFHGLRWGKSGCTQLPLRACCGWHPSSQRLDQLRRELVSTVPGYCSRSHSRLSKLGACQGFTAPESAVVKAAHCRFQAG